MVWYLGKVQTHSSNNETEYFKNISPTAFMNVIFEICIYIPTKAYHSLNPTATEPWTCLEVLLSNAKFQSFYSIIDMIGKSLQELCKS